MSDPRPQILLNTAEEFGLVVDSLDDHVEAVHGFEPHDAGYDAVVREAAYCLVTGSCPVTPCCEYCGGME